MNKKIIKKIKINKILGAGATPAPPIGPILGGSGVNIIAFCNEFNTRTKDKVGKLCPVSIIVYEDKTFDFYIHQPSIAVQLLNLLKIKKGSKEPNRLKIGKINVEDINLIAQDKLIDMNCYSIDSAISMIIGTAKSMGIEIIK
jgi:large subunit ribosomal protein L11